MQLFMLLIYTIDAINLILLKKNILSCQEIWLLNIYKNILMVNSQTKYEFYIFVDLYLPSIFSIIIYYFYSARR